MSAGRDDDLRAEPTTKDPKEVWQRFKVAHLEFYIERSRILYAQTRNPIHAFKAYRAARAAKIDIPEWVFGLFDQWAEVLCEKKRPKGMHNIAAALGLGTKGGGPSITSQAETQSRCMWIAEYVLALRNYKARAEVDVLVACDSDFATERPERSMADIFARVAKEFNLSKERVASIWYEQTRGAKH